MSRTLSRPAGPSQERARIGINGLARDIDVPPNRISAILAGKRGITADTALPPGKYFSVSPELWLDLQSDYDLRVLRRST